MSSTRSGWIGWWIVTAVLVALIAYLMGWYPKSVKDPRALLKKSNGDAEVDPTPPPPPAPIRPGTPRRPGVATQPLNPQTPRPSTPVRRPQPPVTDPGDGTTPPPLSQRSKAPVDVLRELQWAQKRFLELVHVDEDHDGTGEYGGLAEMSRAVGGRMGRPIREPLIQRELGQLNQHGEGRLGDYHYRIWLPGRFGIGIGELWGGAGAAQYDPNLAEDYWLCYAWPARGVSGPTYFLSQDNRLLSTTDPRYSGSGNGPRAGAALRRGEIEDMLAPAATNAKGLDGNTWRTAR